MGNGKGKFVMFEKMKKFLATILALLMMSSYMSLFANVSEAARIKDVSNFKSRVYSYPSGYSYRMNEFDKKNMGLLEKWLFWDSLGVFQNLTCIRTGTGHASNYKEVDLFNLKNADPNSYNLLFGDYNTSKFGYNKYLSEYTGEERYKHILWEIEHFYLFYDGDTNSAKAGDTQEDRERRFNEFNSFVGGTAPYGNNDTVNLKLTSKFNGSVVDYITRYKNENLIKTLQNELLMIYVNQTFNRKSDLSQIRANGSVVSQNVQTYANNIVNTFTNMDASRDYNIEESHYQFNRGNVVLTKTQDQGNAEDNISGSFALVNHYPNHAKITVKEVKVNGVVTTDYEILDNNNSVIAPENVSNVFSNNSNTVFKIRATNLQSVDVTLNVDYGDIVNATLLVPTDVGSYQYLININKEHKQYDISSSAELNKKSFDLALTKQVTGVSNSYVSLNRLRDINTDLLVNGNSKNAQYLMDKTKVSVKDGCTVTYRINVYNEGEIDGFAEQIKDYLPEGLEFIPASESEINRKYNWKVDANNSKIISTDYLSSKGNEDSTNKLYAFNGEDFKEATVRSDGTRDSSEKQTMAHVELELKVNVGQNSDGKVLDNRAEISKYGYYADTNADGEREFNEASKSGIDRDSIQNSVRNNGQPASAAELSNEIENRVAEKAGAYERYIDKNKIAFEDDDDIERLVVKEDLRYMDLALRKWIDTVDGKILTGEENRAPSQNEDFEDPTLDFATECLREGTLNYDNPKLAVQLAPGSVVKYKIGIYNEGLRDSYAQEVTDYLPEGLEFIPDSKVNKDNGWEEVPNSNGRAIRTEILSKEKETGSDNSNCISSVLQAYTNKYQLKYDEYLPAYRILEIECKVKENVSPNTYLTNRAEITKYGYYKDNTFIECNKDGVDLDSRQNTIKDDLRLDEWYENWVNNEYDPGTQNDTVPGVQDDDDFETVQVVVNEGKYQLEVIKIDSVGNKINTDDITRVFKTTLNNENMASESTTSSSIKYQEIAVNSVGEDTIDIEEVEQPQGYAKLNYKIRINIGKEIENGSYSLKIDNVQLLNEDNTVYEEYDEFVPNGVYTQGSKTEPMYRLYMEDSYIDFVSSGKIFVNVVNKKIDVALKKSITEVTHKEQTKQVSIENGFNVGRFEDGVYINPRTTSLAQTTNAEYIMNKTPVEVSIGDIVEYEIRIFNEGQVDAGASVITDYIPKGLKVRNVYYQDNDIELTQNDNVGNTYTYDEQNGVLKVYLRDVDLIQAYTQNNELKSDYIRVKCLVDDTAEGVLTNTAEISMYYYKKGNDKAEIDKDIDSTAGNWIAPSTDKGSAEWKNYSNNQDNLIDYMRHNFVSQDSGLNNNKGDDDDFDKVIVRGKYEVIIQKTDETGNSISDIPFTITRQKDSVTENLDTAVSQSEFAYVDEYSILDDVTEITYTIEEGKNANYDQVKGKMHLDVKIENGNIAGYKLNALNTQNSYTVDSSKEYTFSSTMGGTVNVTVQLDRENSKINVIIKNKPIDNGAYSILLRKVSSDDTTKVLNNVKFNVTTGASKDYKTFDNNIITPATSTLTTGQEDKNNDGNADNDGLATIVQYDITNSNYSYVDKYLISEIDLGTENSTYTKLTTNLAVYVAKKYNTAESKYEIASWGIVKEGENLNLATNRIFNGNGSIEITEGNLTYTITAQEVRGIITINVPNIPETTTYLRIKKVDKDTDENLENVKLQVRRVNQEGAILVKTGVTDSNGELDSQIGVEASTTEVEYNIKEVKAAPGYDNVLYSKYINIKLQLNNGEVTGITEATVRNIGGDVDTTLTSPEYFEATISPTDSHMVVLKLKNKKTDKKVDLALKKVITEVDGKQVKASNGFDEKYDRYEDEEVVTTPLDEEKKDAEYLLNKTPVLVMKGSKVKYQIRIYNESSEIAATASEIKDYLPAGLKLVDVYYKDGTKLTSGTDYTYDETNKVITTGILNSKELIPAYIPGDGTNNGQISYDYIIVECVVEETANGVLTNVAEISQYKTTEGIIDQDIDSWSGNWENPNDNNPNNNNNTSRITDNWVNYSGDNTIDEGEFKNYIGQEDDDDFEKVVVGEVDLVLKKIITKIGDVTEDNFNQEYKRFQDGKVIVDTSKMDSLENVTTSEYMLNKTTIPVNVDDVITYQIRIYNEGTVDAQATEITDYIPKGLDFVAAYYDGTRLVENTDYTISNNVLRVHALEDLIPAYTNNGNPSFDNKLTIECKVNGDVKGILTNVAEITEYTTLYGVIEADRDSQTTGNGEWSPVGAADKLTIDGKSGTDWARYYNIYSKGVFEDYPGQQDDDDFEKVILQSDYKIKLRKISAMDTSEGLGNVEFKINSDSYVTNENGYTDTVTKQLSQNGLDTYEINENTVNNNYVKLKNDLYFGVEKYEKGTGEIVITGYILNVKESNYNKGNHVKLKGTNTTNTFIAKDVNDNNVNVTINAIYENGEYTFEIIVENTIPDQIYNIYLKKVDNNGQNVENAEFVVETSQFHLIQNIVTTENLSYIATNKITKDTYEEVDNVKILEINTAEGLIKLPNTINVDIIKGLTEDKTAYEIKEVKLTYDNLESTKEGENKFIIKDIPIGRGDKKVDITAELQDLAGANNETVKSIVITIPNERVADGNYNIFVNKIDENKQYIADAKFEITGEDSKGTSINEFVIPSVTTDGTATANKIVEANITKDNVDVVDIYTIKEVQAPEGYYKLKNAITVKVEKGLNSEENEYVIKAFYVDGKRVDENGLTLTGYLLENASILSRARIIASVTDNTLTLQVQDSPKIGSYRVYIQKVNQFNEYMKDVEFEVTGKDSENADLTSFVNSPIVTDGTEEAKLIINRYMSKAVINTEDEYTITETKTLDEYYKLDEPILIRVTKKYIDTGIGIDKLFVNNEEVTNGSITKEVKLQNTDKKAKVLVTLEKNTVTVQVENVLHDSSYNILVNKVDENNKYLANVKFGITGTDSNNNSLQAYITTPVTTDGTENAKQIVRATISRDNVELVDTYSIEEIEAPEGYFKLEKPITVKVEKTMNEDKTAYIVSKFYVDDNVVTEDGVTLRNYKLLNAKEGIKAAINASVKDNTLTFVVENITKDGEYKVLLNKVDEKNNYLEGAVFEITGVDSKNEMLSKYIKSPITTDGAENAKEIVNRYIKKADAETTDIYTIKEVAAPMGYYKLKDSIIVKITKKIGNSSINIDKVYVNDKEVVDGAITLDNIALEDTERTVKATITVKDNVVTVIVENKLKEFDLTLRKFISKVNNSKLTGEKSREPQVDLSTLINGDSTKNGEKTATYNHTKEALLVNPGDLIDYTLRIYNEGELDGYASRVIDDVPEGVTMVAPKYDENGNPINLNAKNRWVMYKEVSEEDMKSANSANKSILKYADKYYVETENAEETVLISTDYLSKTNGEAMMNEEIVENPNLIKAFDGKTLSYKDINVQFVVKKDNDPNKIYTNHAQISEHNYKDGTPIIDRDSTPNVWKDKEDDQDIENIKVTWFDLALYKWVSSTIVTEDGKTKEYASGHTENNKDKIVNVTIAKDKINSTVVKFKWQIKVKNESPIPGYAKEIKDHIPDGLKFVEEDNKEFGWKLQEDGTITTNYLKDTLLQPEDTAEVTVILTWINNENNLGVKVNNAEISKDYNTYGTPDIDSTPNNFKGEPVEDDEDKDEVRLNVKTGNGIEIAYVLIGVVLIAVIAGGVFGIKKYVM